MTAKSSSTVNLGLSDIPETTDPKLFPEFLRIYNAIKILAQGLDDYTDDGTVTTTLETIYADVGSSVSVLARNLKVLTTQLQEFNEAANTYALLMELQKQYRRYTVPTFTVIGAFACNGKLPQISYALGAAAGNAAAGGVGTAAGGWDTAANRDATIATINAHAVAINNIQIALKNNGIGV